MTDTSPLKAMGAYLAAMSEAIEALDTLQRYCGNGVLDFGERSRPVLYCRQVNTGIVKEAHLAGVRTRVCERAFSGRPARIVHKNALILHLEEGEGLVRMELTPSYHHDLGLVFATREDVHFQVSLKNTFSGAA